MFFGGSLIVENNTNTRCSIDSVDLTGGINNKLTVNSNLSTYIGKSVTIHYAGLNVVKTSGFTGVNTTTPGSVLSVNGSMSLPIHSTDTDMTLDCTHYTVICDISSNNITITLPINDNSIKGRIYILKQIGGNTLYIDPNGSNIDTVGGNYTVITSFIKLQSDGTDWWIIG
jgi:hypothetical protein